MGDTVTRPVDTALHPIYHVWHVGKRLAAWLTVGMLYALAVEWTVISLEWEASAAGKYIATLLGLVLGIVLVLRINSANERWWEARKLWGQLINDSRNLALKARAHAAASESEFRELGTLLIAFAHALRLHLRGVDVIHEVPGMQTDPARFKHAPGYVVERLHQLLNHWNRSGQLRDTIWILDVHARSLIDICGACERIRNTPLASAFRAIVLAGIGCYMLAIPWIVAAEAGWPGMFVLAIAYFFLLGLEFTAEEIEEPFGTQQDDLPLERYCDTIEQFVTDTLFDLSVISPRPENRLES
jgi:putative membrane protein